MRHLLQVGSLLLATAMGLGGCSDITPTGPRSAPDSPNIGTIPLHRPHLSGLDAEFTRLANEIPGFGGLFYDDSGRLNVYLTRSRPGARTPPVRDGAAMDEIASKLGAFRAELSPASQEMVVHEGRYDFLELGHMRSRMSPVLTVPGAVFIGIDETKNRLRIGVEEGTSSARIQQMLQQLDIPREAVNIEITEPIVPLANSSLIERVQPFGGGLQLVFPNPMPGFVSVCTLGFNILRDAPGRSQSFFVTNSHCSLDQGAPDDTPYYQQPVARLRPRYLIGMEVADPEYFPCPLFLGFVCRFSDASVAKYEAARTPVKFGSIYRTASVGTDGQPGSTEIQGPKFFTIVDEQPFPVIGETLDKVGRTTGWTRGPVIGTCLDVLQLGSNRVILCQDLVLAAIAAGDSGAPVFKPTGRSRDVTLYGILWGGAEGLYVFSAMENIHLDLGEFRTH